MNFNYNRLESFNSPQLHDFDARITTYPNFQVAF